eukprot:NODE_205_length_12934_cov_1.115933.p4 type:complete len:398 gc:universal NODE_205_length_12934_cov_1.115933:4011-5204(+)
MSACPLDQIVKACILQSGVYIGRVFLEMELVQAIFLFIYIAVILGCSIYMLKLRKKTSFFRYRFCWIILFQNVILSLSLIALSRPAVFGEEAKDGELDPVFCEYIYWVSYGMILVPVILHPLRSWTFYFNYQSSRAKLLASTADPLLFQPLNDIPFVKLDLQWFLLKKKYGHLKYASTFYAIFIAITFGIYIVIRYTTDDWSESRVTINPKYCPMMTEIDLVAVIGAIGFILNFVMTTLLSKCRENIKLELETGIVNISIMVMVVVYLLSLFESVSEVIDCEDFRRVCLIVVAVCYMVGNTLFPLVYYYFKFKKGLADGSALKENLQNVFNNPQLKMQFKEFLVSEFSVENFLFLEAIKKFKKKYEGEVDLNIIRKGVQEVYSEFFAKVLVVNVGCA